MNLKKLISLEFVLTLALLCVATAGCEADNECTGAAPLCTEFCGSDVAVTASCVDGEWHCPGNSVETDSCDSSICMAPAPRCVDTCVEPTVDEVALCTDDGQWTCPDPMLFAEECPQPSCEVTSTSTIPGVRVEFLGERCRWSFSDAEQEGELRYRVVVEERLEVNASPPGGNTCKSEVSHLVIEEVIEGSDGQKFCRCDFGLCAPLGPQWITLEPGVTYHTFEWAPYNWNGPSDTDERYGEPFEPGEFTATVSTRAQVRRDDGTVEDVEAQSTLDFRLE